jgi:hypothetical protein
MQEFEKAKMVNSLFTFIIISVVSRTFYQRYFYTFTLLHLPKLKSYKVYVQFSDVRQVKDHGQLEEKGREGREEDEARLWSRRWYSKTVLSANPMERWARLRERAMHETG